MWSLALEATDGLPNGKTLAGTGCYRQPEAVLSNADFLMYMIWWTEMQKLIAWCLSSVFCKNFIYEVSEAPWILFGINSWYRSRVVLEGLVCMLKLLADIIVLKNVNYSKKHNNIIILPSWFSYELKFTFISSHSLFHTCWHVQA